MLTYLHLSKTYFQIQNLPPKKKNRKKKNRFLRLAKQYHAVESLHINAIKNTMLFLRGGVSRDSMDRSTHIMNRLMLTKTTLT